MHDQRTHVAAPPAQDGTGERRRGAHLAAVRVAGARHNAERPHCTVQTNSDRATNFDM